MLINYIKIENFLSYYGNDNKFDFDDGPTLIIGQNRTGKSKLFDAFKWVFYDKAYNTDIEKWDTTKELNMMLVNELAKRKCKIGNDINVSVEVGFKDEEENTFLLCREYIVKKLNSKEWDYSSPSELSLSKTEFSTNNSEDYFGKDAIDKLRLLFPENLSKYFLFQGENISQIMSLTNRSDFKRALRDLSRIEVFENAKDISQKVFKRIEKEFQNASDKNEEIQFLKKKLDKEINELVKEIEISETKLDNFIKEKEIITEKLEEKERELSKFKECSILLKEIKELKRNLGEETETMNMLFDSQKKDIFNIWMYAGTEQILKNFLDFYNKNKEEKKIPEPIRQDFIKEMLKDELCMVCGRDAKKGSKEYNRIKWYLNEKSLEEEIELINNLAYLADTQFNKVISINNQIEEFYSKIDKYEKRIKTIHKTIESKKEELNSVKPQGFTEEKLYEINFEQLKQDRIKFDRERSEYEVKINQEKGKQEYKKNELEKKRKELDNLIINSSNTLEKERYFLAEKIKIFISQFHDAFNEKLIKDIEHEANIYFRKMTELNQSLSGAVKVDYDLKEVYTIDENGYRLSNINQANKVSLQISFVAAVLSVSNKFWNTYFPFIADAPISALGGNNKLTAIETMINIFGQSIIILKDDAIITNKDSVKNDQVRLMINRNARIKNAYELTMEGKTINEQRTKIIKLK